MTFEELRKKLNAIWDHIDDSNQYDIQGIDMPPHGRKAIIRELKKLIIDLED